ncbi:hypothetical protein ATO46_11070 [Aeromonas schubertii]|uniref:DUF4382 domain-containing protein n=1 Tax=Aeromonas schubertii TaxID=652 RepID=UPI00067F099F|nr:DUF4382 domain-containing protein [Aeromonas schubertii]KUE78226.1 hypothetical protein ATO46_11070 [Aeromonas schubertii]
MKRLLLLGLTTALTACGGGDGGSSGSTSDARFSLAFSDAPVDSAKRVCIAVSRISIHPIAGGETAWSSQSILNAAQDDGCTPLGESIPLNTDGSPRFVYIDLLKYQGSASRNLLAGQSVSAGEYSQMRLTVLDGREAANQFDDGTPYSYVQQDDDTIKPLEVPSSELKLDAFTIAANGTSSFTTEFDLRHSMVLPGHLQYYKLKPRGVRLVNNSEAATLSGSIAGGLCGGLLADKGAVYLYAPRSDDNYPDMADADNGFYASAPVVSDGAGGFRYELGFVAVGSYDLALVCNSDQDDPEGSGDVLYLGPVLKAQAVAAPTTTINLE